MWYVYVYIYTYVCIYVPIYVYVHVYVYIYYEKQNWALSLICITFRKVLAFESKLSAKESDVGYFIIKVLKSICKCF